MKNRQALIVEIKDNNNNIGLGEIWCNFPNDNALYKFQLLKNIFLKKIININIYNPSDVYKIYSEVQNIFVQSNDLGSYNSILSGLNCALWDLFAKKKNISLNKFLNTKNSEHISLYASGINPKDAIQKIKFARNVGIKSFKIKIGFDNNLDLNLINKIINLRSSNENIMFDVNQAWNIKKANKYLKLLKQFPIHWIEEPISAMTNDSEYLSLINSSNIPIALGENISNESQFELFLKNKNIQFIQPDITKFGGISFIQNYLNSKFKKKFYLHFLGSGVGFITSAHVMSAINKDGLLETDFNDNPLRDLIFRESIKILNGQILLSKRPGIGYSLNKFIIKKYLVNTYSV